MDVGDGCRTIGVSSIPIHICNMEDASCKYFPTSSKVNIYAYLADQTSTALSTPSPTPARPTPQATGTTKVTTPDPTGAPTRDFARTDNSDSCQKAVDLEALSQLGLAKSIYIYIYILPMAVALFRRQLTTLQHVVVGYKLPSSCQECGLLCEVQGVAVFVLH
jgi:hypothetical protein